MGPRAHRYAWEKIYLLLVPGIQPRLLGHQARSLVAIPNSISRQMLVDVKNDWGENTAFVCLFELRICRIHFEPNHLWVFFGIFIKDVEYSNWCLRKQHTWCTVEPNGWLECFFVLQFADIIWDMLFVRIRRRNVNFCGSSGVCLPVLL
jgi:hypothetical protein